MKKYKIVLKPSDIVFGEPNTENNRLSNFNGYLIHTNNSIENGLVNEYNVRGYLDNPDNESVVTRFKQYLSANTDNELQFNEIYYKSEKVYPILNDFYNEEIRFRSEANNVLVQDALDGTQVVTYRNNNFDFETNQRLDLDERSKLVEIFSGETQLDYYINFSINIKEDSVYSTDYSQYIKDCVEDGVVLKNCFVDLNKHNDPFEYWTNNKPQLSQEESSSLPPRPIRDAIRNTIGRINN
jgi:hypothetical protein